MRARKIKKAKLDNINIYNSDNEIIYSGIVEGIPIKDKCIVDLSIKYYDNREPCMLIRSAVLSNIYLQFFNIIESQGCEDVYILDLPKELREYVEI